MTLPGAIIVGAARSGTLAYQIVPALKRLMPAGWRPRASWPRWMDPSMTAQQLNLDLQPVKPEEWLPVLGYEGLYEVSDHGRVRSVTHTVDTFGRWGEPHRRTFKGRILRQQIVGESYPAAHLSKNGRGRARKIHVLMLEAFIGPRPPGHDGCHNDGNKSNNTLANLRWDTRAGNFGDKRLHGTAHGMHRHARAKLTDDDRAAIAASTGALHVIAKQYDVSSSVVKILRRGVST